MIDYISIIFLTIGILFALSLIVNFFIFFIIPFFIFNTEKTKVIYSKFLKRFTFRGALMFPYLLTITNKGFNRIFNIIFFYESVKETEDKMLINRVNILRHICRVSSLIISLTFLIFILFAFLVVILFITALIVNGTGALAG